MMRDSVRGSGTCCFCEEIFLLFSYASLSCDFPTKGYRSDNHRLPSGILVGSKLLDQLGYGIFFKFSNTKFSYILPGHCCFFEAKSLSKFWCQSKETLSCVPGRRDITAYCIVDDLARVLPCYLHGQKMKLSSGLRKITIHMHSDKKHISKIVKLVDREF